MGNTDQDLLGLGRNDSHQLQRDGDLLRDLLADVTQRHAPGQRWRPGA